MIGVGIYTHTAVSTSVFDAESIALTCNTLLIFIHTYPKTSSTLAHRIRPSSLHELDGTGGRVGGTVRAAAIAMPVHLLV